MNVLSEVPAESCESEVPGELPERDVLSRLKKKSWFRKSSRAVRSILLGLPIKGMDDGYPEALLEAEKQDCSGFLEHLVNRPDEGGGVKLLYIESILLPPTAIFGIFLNFKVQNLTDPSKEFCYQYFGWRQGPMSGAKGLILVECEGAITHVVCQRGFSFAVGAEVFDCPGGFAEANETTLNAMLPRFQKEVQEELGIDSMKLLRPLDLGPVHLDRGMTFNCPRLFAAVIDGSTASKIREGEHVNPDVYEMRSGPVIVPVSQLYGANGFLMRNTDAYFHACVSRLIALGVIKGPS